MGFRGGGEGREGKGDRIWDNFHGHVKMSETEGETISLSNQVYLFVFIHSFITTIYLILRTYFFIIFIHIIIIIYIMYFFI